MANGLNGQFKINMDRMLDQYVLSTIYLRAGVNGYLQLAGGAGPFRFDITWGQIGQWLALRVLPPGQDPVYDSGIPAYWLRQGGYIDIPIHGSFSNFVFTPELSGCEIYVDKLNAGTYRIYHVEVPHRAHQYVNRPHGMGLEESLLFSEYGRPNNISRCRSTALMHFSGSDWTLLGQVIIGQPQGFQSGQAITIGHQRVRKVITKPLGDLGLVNLFS